MEKDVPFEPMEPTNIHSPSGWTVKPQKRMNKTVVKAIKACETVTTGTQAGYMLKKSPVVRLMVKSSNRKMK